MSRWAENPDQAAADLVRSALGELELSGRILAIDPTLETSAGACSSWASR